MSIVLICSGKVIVVKLKEYRPAVLRMQRIMLYRDKEERKNDPSNFVQTLLVYTRNLFHLLIVFVLNGNPDNIGRISMLLYRYFG